jgi:hypothetical protein
MFSESTCSGVSEISNQKILHALLGVQVPQHDVTDMTDICMAWLQREFQSWLHCNW